MRDGYEQATVRRVAADAGWSKPDTSCPNREAD
jgi:hypothetical protein